MKDRKSNKKPLKHVKKFLSNSFNSKELQDEAYIQIIKQITNHPDYIKSKRGWNMLAIVASTYPPSDELFYSIMNFLFSEIKNSKNEEIVKRANYVIARLNRQHNSGKRECIPCDKEIFYIEVNHILYS